MLAGKTSSWQPRNAWTFEMAAVQTSSEPLEQRIYTSKVTTSVHVIFSLSFLIEFLIFDRFQALT